MTHSIRSYRLQQCGMTLINFMVGMTVGLLVVLAAVSSLIMTSSSARTISDSAGLEQQASLLMMQMGQQISQAGAVTARATSANNLPYISFDTTAIGGVNAQYPTVSVFGGIGTIADAAGYFPDNLVISYTAPNDGGLAVNCIGNNPDAASRIVSRFAIPDKTTNLNCGNDSKNSTSQPIAGNVVDMKILYLLVDGNGNVVYQGAVPGLNWNQVKGVQVCLELEGDPTQSPQHNFTDCRDKKRMLIDGRIHRVVRQTFYLRNTH